MGFDLFPERLDLALPGGPVRCYVAGPVDGPLVVLLHGAMLDSAALTWLHVGPDLARDHRVWAVDLPRHGVSRPWRDTVDQAAMEGVVDAVLRRAARPATLVGLSMGAGVALGHALRRPDGVRAVVLSVPGGLGAVRPWQRTTWLATRSVTVLRGLSRLLAHSPAAVRRSVLANLSAGDRSPGVERVTELAIAEIRAKADHREPVLDDWQRLAFGPTRMRLDLLPQLGSLAVPSLWLRGAEDPLVGSAEVDAAVALAPGAVGVTVDGAGHLASLDQPVVFGRLVREFVAGRRADPA